MKTIVEFCGAGIRDALGFKWTLGDKHEIDLTPFGVAELNHSPDWRAEIPINLTPPAAAGAEDQDNG